MTIIHEFSCRFCPTKNSSLLTHLKHRIQHRHISSTYYCGFNGCNFSFINEPSLRAHIIRCHQHRTRLSLTSSILNASNRSGKFVCTVSNCQKTVDNYNELIKHLKFHMKSGLFTKCPFGRCDNKYRNIQSFSGHLSKCHRSSVMEELETVDEQVDRNCPQNCVQAIQDENINPLDTASDFHHGNSCDDFDDDTFLVSMCQFLMKLELKLMIPVRTVQYIVDELRLLQSQDEATIRKRLEWKLVREGLPKNTVESIVSSTFRESPIRLAFNGLQTDHKRKETFKKKFAFIPPQPIPLVCQPSNRQKYFYYVCLKETVRAMFLNKSIDLLANLSENREGFNGVYRDYTDGYVFKNNEFFQRDPNCLHFILFQDAFEIANPLGAAKKKYKILAVYVSIGNLPSYLRSHVNNIQLVALCVEKDFKHSEVYGRIVNDLKELETDGVFVPGHGVVKGSLLCIVGDNLGSHGAGGFVENFSVAKYFCRYCEIHRDVFHSEDGECVVSELRTVASYDHCLHKLARITAKIYKGVKFNSVFNELKYFHVCLPGLPPCLAHDLFEGLVSYDLKLFIDYFVEQDWFTFDSLEKAMGKFPYCADDKRDCPVPVKADNVRVKGGAWQVHIFLRLFPLIMKNFICDINDEVWQTLLILIEVVEIVVAPVIDESYLPYLESLISEYLSNRKRLFCSVSLRPKHHYLMHYPELILAFGPLIRVFTLRFESKHSFFKRIMRIIHNFKNPMKSLATKHEYFQAYLRTGADYKCPVEIHGDIDFISHNYSDQLQRALSDVPAGARECVKAVVKGIPYLKGNVVITRQGSYQSDVQLGRISLILFDNSQCVYLLVEILQNQFLPSLRAYKLGTTIRCECIKVKDLMSYQSLHVYTLNSKLYVKLKFGLVCDKLL